MKCAIHGDDEKECRFYSGTDQCIGLNEKLDSGNYAEDKLYKAMDSLYLRGWTDKHKARDCDPRGTKEWQFVLDIIRSLARKMPDDDQHRKLNKGEAVMRAIPEESLRNLLKKFNLADVDENLCAELIDALEEIDVSSNGEELAYPEEIIEMAGELERVARFLRSLR